jgi:hypothetical protein
VSGEFRLADTSIMTIGSAVRRRAAVATGALIAGALVAIGITVLIAAHGEGTKSGEIPPLIGSWTITRIDVGSAQQVTVPAGHASIDWYPPSETDIPGPDGQPTHVRADAELDIVDVSCTYTRDGNTLTSRSIRRHSTWRSVTQLTTGSPPTSPTRRPWPARQAAACRSHSVMSYAT